jgi:hypothetical protein
MHANGELIDRSSYGAKPGVVKPVLSAAVSVFKWAVGMSNEPAHVDLDTPLIVTEVLPKQADKLFDDMMRAINPHSVCTAILSVTVLLDRLASSGVHYTETDVMFLLEELQHRNRVCITCDNSDRTIVKLPIDHFDVKGM